NEFRIGSCKADLIILNGTGTVYEIKSERDSLSRLHNQITNYRKAFGKIYVIAGSEHIDDVLKTTESTIGVLSLTRWNRISTIR
ncbi:sce7726 family protein, partial [Klebsiella pneumoniae]